MSERVTLVSPDGGEYKTSDKREIVRLKSRGYKVKSAPAPANKSVEPKSNK